MYKEDFVPVFAHRGASGRALENTMNAFMKAQALGANGIELDVQLSVEGIPVVFHDLNLKRLTGVDRLVNQSTMDELLRLKVGKPFWRVFSNKRISTFTEVVEWANQEQMPLNIELKESLIGHDDVLSQLVTNLHVPEGSHFSSFHIELLEIVKNVAPQFETALIATKALKWELLQNLTQIDAIHAHKRYYKQRYLEACVVARKQMRFYAINGNEAYLKQPHPVVAGWITDYPEKVLKIQKKTGL